MVNNMYQHCMPGLGDSWGALGHVLPFVLLRLRPTDGVNSNVCLEHIGFGAQGVSLPICRGSPPAFT